MQEVGIVGLLDDVRGILQGDARPKGVRRKLERPARSDRGDGQSPSRALLHDVGDAVEGLSRVFAYERVTGDDPALLWGEPPWVQAIAPGAVEAWVDVFASALRGRGVWMGSVVVSDRLFGLWTSEVLKRTGLSTTPALHRAVLDGFGAWWREGVEALQESLRDGDVHVSVYDVMQASKVLRGDRGDGGGDGESVQAREDDGRDEFRDGGVHDAGLAEQVAEDGADDEREGEEGQGESDVGRDEVGS